MGAKLLIDGDVIAYRAGFASEKTKYLATSATDGGVVWGTADSAKDIAHVGGCVWTRKELQPVDQALLITNVMINDIKERYAAENLTPVVCLTGTGNFRHSVATRATYKGNRSGSVPPVHLKAIRQHLTDKGAVVSAGEEADDVLGILATENPGSIIASIDKDLMMIPGRNYNFVTKEETTISPKQAMLNFYAQVLSGDSVDNIPGVAGIGPVKAARLVADCATPKICWQRIVDVYKKEFGDAGEKFALEAARLVWIRRQPGEMWCPPTAR